MYLAVPIVLYVGERTLRFCRSGFYTVRLIKVSKKKKIGTRTITDFNKLKKKNDATRTHGSYFVEKKTSL